MKKNLLVGLLVLVGFLMSFNAAVAAETSYKIIFGDTLIKIAEKHGNKDWRNYRTIAKRNHIKNPNLIFAGRTIVISDFLVVKSVSKISKNKEVRVSVAVTLPLKVKAPETAILPQQEETEEIMQATPQEYKQILEALSEPQPASQTLVPTLPQSSPEPTIVPQSTPVAVILPQSTSEPAIVSQQSANEVAAKAKLQEYKQILKVLAEPQPAPQTVIVPQPTPEPVIVPTLSIVPQPTAEPVIVPQSTPEPVILPQTQKEVQQKEETLIVRPQTTVATQSQELQLSPASHPSTDSTSIEKKKSFQVDTSMEAFYGCSGILTKCKGINGEVSSYKKGDSSHSFGANFQAYGATGWETPISFTWKKINGGGGLYYKYIGEENQIIVKQDVLFQSLKKSLSILFFKHRFDFDSNQQDLLSLSSAEYLYHEKEVFSWGVNASWLQPITNLKFSSDINGDKKSDESAGEVTLVAKQKVGNFFRVNESFSPIIYHGKDSIIGSNTGISASIAVGFKNYVTIEAGVLYPAFGISPQLKSLGVKAKDFTMPFAAIKFSF